MAMEKTDKQSVLDRTHYGLDIYAHILRKYYPGKTVLSFSGRTCSPARNPFNDDKPTLLVDIVDDEARHTDTENAIAQGNAFDFAELHHKLIDNELLQTLNSEMHLEIGEKKDFYSHSKVTKSSPQSTVCSENQEETETYFSFFKAPIQNTKPYKSISLFDAYKYIIGDYAKQRTQKLRALLSQSSSLEGQGAARQFKATNFDYCTFSGIFTTRNDKALINHSGLLCLDFDHLKSVDLLRNQLLQDEYFDTQLLFVSPSGDGLKWIIPIDTSLTPHVKYFNAVANYILQTYGMEVDKSGRDISRACFLPHDPKAYINPQLLYSHKPA